MLSIRRAEPGDAESCGRIFYEAFAAIAAAHNFPPDLPQREMAIGLIASMLQDPHCYPVVAEEDGRIVGSNFLWETTAIKAVGPISVDVSAQSRGIGRQLMQAVIDRGRDAAGIRLTQDAYHCRSMSLYAALGFDVKEPLALLEGRPRNAAPPDSGVVRPFLPSDLAGCEELSVRAHGFSRAAELQHGGPMVQGWVLERPDGRIAAYATSLHFWPYAHGVAESEPALRALILGAAAARPEPLAFIFPTRQSALYRWLLGEGMRMVKPMTLMSMGRYQDPAIPWFPSVLY